MPDQIFPTGDALVTHSCGHKNLWLMTNADKMSKADFIKMKSAEPCPTCEREKKQPSSKIIQLVVDRHPGGNHTLKCRSSQAEMFVDCEGDLFCNNNKEIFYRMVARQIAALSQQGFQVFYEDVRD